MQVNRALINSKFEGYRLSLIAQDDYVSRFGLQYPATQATVSGKAPLTFQEVQSRISHNHITLPRDGSRALYVDASRRVISVSLNEDSLAPSFHVLYELPTPVQSEDTQQYQSEYPSAAFLTSTIIFVSDGHGSLYILESLDGHSATLRGVYVLPTLSDESSAPIPFKIHDATISLPSSVTVILSSRHHAPLTEAETATPAKARKVHVEFDIWAISFSFPFNDEPDQVRPMNVIWRRRGDDVPIYVIHEAERNAFMLLGSSVYRTIDQPPQPEYTPTPEEIAPIPQADESMDVEQPIPERPPPYSWTQTSDSVTVAFPLPASIPKSDINVSFSPRAITLQVKGGDLSTLPLPSYTDKSVWDTIQPSSSYWTWDKEGERSYGILTLHLDKQQEDLKWQHVFAAAAQPNETDIDVPETLDPSELWKVREALEKYTAALREGEDPSGLGLGKGMPSLAEGEIDEEVDSAVGRNVVVTWIADDGSTPSWFSDTRQAPVTILSTPLPGASESCIPSIVTKNNVDGAVFALSSSSRSEWDHISTFSALAFVLASKQDTRFTYHIPWTAAFAFENGSSGRGGNLYIYRAAPLQETWAKQAVLKIGNGLAGSLLGVGALRVGDDTILACLTEGELVIVAGVV
ncbi:hypothetical protein BDN71DRAFT_1467056 [Pleurotus eryngii]|uniref:NudC domain-containing protein 1 n=1 Tax=Pleurotus eryngii TaxID=5323 RepID=A0A9P6DHM8_PLEER|nr:hypothetical protein BDN71DRAFT_1467056 [Pleurotus eryngii]